MSAERERSVAAGPSPTSATIAPHILRYLDLVLTEGGHDLSDALRRVGLSRSLLDRPQLRLSDRQGRTVIDGALDLWPHPALGLLVGGRQPLAAAGLLGLGMMSAATFDDGIRLGLRFQNLVGSMVRWDLVEEGAEWVVTASLRHGGDHSRVDRFLVEEGLASIDRLARGCLAPGFRPRRVEFAHLTDDQDGTHRRTFECPISFDGPRNAWVVPAALAGTGLPGADRWTHAAIVGLLEEQVELAVDRQELVALLAAQIADDLPAVAPMAAHARRLAQSERSLRRRLAETGTTFAALVDEVRQHRVEHLLRSPTRSLSEIARTAGFTDERSLRRAVQRWYGTGPARLRSGWLAGRTEPVAPDPPDDQAEPI